MKPTLYEANTTTFTKYGLGTLSDAISCIVTEERNGAYELEMEYPVDGIHYEDITHSRIIYATPSDGASKQAFRIYKISKPMDGIITVNAEHISYQLAYIPNGAFTANGVSSALLGLKQNAYETCPFEFWTDKTTSGTYKQEVPASIRSRLGGTQGSILDLYGGEYEWDNYTVKLYNNRGANRGVSLRYGKNITDIQQEENISNTITGVVPYYKNDETIVTLPEHAVYSSNASQYPYKRTIVVDFSQEFENTPPTVEQLRAKAESYITASGIGIPKVNIKVSFVPLWQTEEYKDVAALERVKLCDTVNVYFEALGIEAQAKVIKTVYDVLVERYNTIELGEATSKMSSKTAALEMSAVEQLSSSDLDKAIAHATALITGGLGGYVIFNKNANGEPEEILIMDTPSTATAVNVIRMNKNGIGFSNTGYSGTYRTGWTIDGRFVADFIASGTLSSITIKGNTIDNGNGTFHVDTDGHLVASDAEITGAIKAGTTITSPSVNGGTVTGSIITNGNNLTISADGTLRAYNADITNSNSAGDYVGLNPNLPQIDIVSHPIPNPDYGQGFYWHERVGAMDYNSLRFVKNYINARGTVYGYTNEIGGDGFSFVGQVVCETYQDGWDDNLEPIWNARFKTNRIFSVNGANVQIYNGDSEDTSSYEWRFQQDGRLVLYDVYSNDWLWYIDTDGTITVNNP